MYFNIDNLDNLDFGIDYTGNELEGAPDLKSVISKYLTGDVQSEQYTSEESDEIWSLNGLLEHSNVPGFLAQVSPYDKWRESLDKESTASNIKSTMYDMSAAKRSGVSKGRKTRSALGQTGLMSGAGQGLLKAHEGDVSRALSGLEGNINKQVLSYQKGINKRRAGYVDELWDLYGTFLETEPTKAVPSQASFTTSEVGMQEIIHEQCAQSDSYHECYEAAEDLLTVGDAVGVDLGGDGNAQADLLIEHGDDAEEWFCDTLYGWFVPSCWF